MSNSDDNRNQLLLEFLRHEGLPDKVLPALNVALTHKSYANEFRSNTTAGLDRHNQRLEFLGDSVLGLVVAQYFYTNKRKISEGELSRLKAMTVCESALRKVAEKLNIGQLLRMGKGEIATGGLTRASNLADAMEAVIGAIFITTDFETARKFVVRHFRDILEHPETVEGNKDYKSALQELLAKRNHLRPEYQLIAADGPDHDKQFTVALFIAGEKKSEGVARTRKQAEQNAARAYLEAQR